MPGKDIESDQIPSHIKRMWVNRALDSIQRQRSGIDTWPADDGTRITMSPPLRQSYNPHIKVYSIIDQDGADNGRRAEFYMRGEHMATLVYGPPRKGVMFVPKRRLINTMYHV